MLHHDGVICDKCHNVTLRKSLLTCIICENTVAKKYFVGKHKYSSLKHTIPQITNIPNNRRQIWKTCYLQKQNFVHMCCRRNVEKSMCGLYRKDDYDFSNFIVSWCLANVRDCEMKRSIYACCITKDLKKQTIKTLCGHIMADIQM